MRKIPLMSKVSQISHLLIHWVAHTVQKTHTSGQQSVIDELLIFEPRSSPVKECWNFYNNSTG